MRSCPRRAAPTVRGCGQREPRRSPLSRRGTAASPLAGISAGRDGARRTGAGRVGSVSLGEHPARLRRSEPSHQLIRKVCNGNADGPFALVALAGAPTMRGHNSIRLLADVTKHKTTQMLYERHQNPRDSITVLIFDQESYLAVFNITKPLYRLFIKQVDRI